MSSVKCLACVIRIELAPASPCSYRRVVNRNPLRAQSTANSSANGIAQIHQGRPPSARSATAESATAGPTAPVARFLAPAGLLRTDSDPVATVTRLPFVLPSSDGSGPDRRVDPGDDLVEHLIQRRARLEAEDALRLLGIGNAPLDVVLERIVVHQREGDVIALDLAPDDLG